jgi:ligand-binding SRPBCC domain-containing protein
VPVKAREEPEAVLAGEVGAAAGARVRDRHAARLAAREVALLVDRDAETALRQLVRRAQPRHAPAEDRDRTAHMAKLSTMASGEHVLRREQRLPGAPADVFAFFADAGNLEAITPAWLGFRIVTPRPIAMGAGTLIEYRLALHRVPLRWLTRIEVWEPGVRFVDVQLRGPYRAWHHTHEFEPDGRGGTVMRDVVRYALPFGPLGELARRAFVARDLEAIFDHRHRRVAELLTRP